MAARKTRVAGTGWGAPRTAARLRDVVAAVSRRVIDEERPRERWAEVTSLDGLRGRFACKFPGETETIIVYYTSAARPGAVGDAVLLAGPPGARRPIDVLPLGQKDGCRWRYVGSPYSAQGAPYNAEPAFESGWVNYDAGYSQLRFCRVNDRVFVEGLVKNGTIGSTIFTLPVGFRPVVSHLNSTHTDGASLARWDVFSGGGVRTLGGSNGYAALEFNFSTLPS